MNFNNRMKNLASGWRFLKVPNSLYIVIIGVLMNVANLYSQNSSANYGFPVEREWLAIHPRIGVLFNQHLPNFVSFGSIVSCGDFVRGSSILPTFSLSLETPIGDATHVGLGVGYIQRGAKIFSNQTSLPARNLVNGNIESVVTENVLTTTLSFIEIQLELRTKLFSIGKSTLRGLVGFKLGIPMTATYSQDHNIVSPEGATFINGGQKTLNFSNGTQKITSISQPLMSPVFGIENLLPVGTSSFFTQQLSVDYTINNVTQDANWKMLGARLDLGYRFSLKSSPPEPPKREEPPPPPPPVVVEEKKIDKPKPLPIISIQLQDVNAKLLTGNELRASLPLVNAIFFPLNSSDIPSSYITDSYQQFETDDAVEYHRNILRSIASILNRNEKGSVTLEGATSGNDEGGVALARKRAESVKSALEKLGIASSRINIRASVNPRISSNPEFAQGKEENRRVDIVLNDAPLQEYVARQQFVELAGTANVKVGSQFLESGEISVIGNATGQQTFPANGGTQQVSFKQRLENDKGQFILDVNASTAPFLSTRDEVAINLSTLKREQIELNLTEFSAILRFDYNSAEFSQANRDLLRQLTDLLPNGSTIEILGSSDVLGDEQKNKELSERRAKATETYLRSITGSKHNITSGISLDKFDDSKPEGRFLNRCIKIRVR
jgi:outer membrane protein OmpA-like peptidoglycan-associated protein